MRYSLHALQVANLVIEAVAIDVVYVVAFRNLSVMEFPYVPMEKAGIFLSLRAFDIIASLLAWAEVFESVERDNHRFFHT